MNKKEFLDKLKKGLDGLPQEDIEERLNFYSEMIDDRIEEGHKEKEAVSDIGPDDDIIKQIISQTPLTKIVKQRVKPKRALEAWEIILIILGFPIWFSILISLFAIVFSIYITFWSIIISLWCVEFSMIISTIFVMIAAIFLVAKINILTLIGIILFLIGISILLFFICKLITKTLILLTKKIILGIKSLLIKKEERNDKDN